MSICKLFCPKPITGPAAAALFALRAVAGLAFVFHGWGKIQNPTGWMGPDATVPAFFQALAAISEFGGGVAWILGCLTSLFSFGILCTMAVATHLHMVIKGDPFVGRGGSYELALLYFTLALFLLFAGPGKYSIDAWMKSKCRRGDDAA